jgi:hypothetical protein
VAVFVEGAFTGWRAGVECAQSEISRVEGFREWVRCFEVSLGWRRWVRCAEVAEYAKPG